MTDKKAKTIFEKYNPASGVVRCPNGRANVREMLDTYAQAAVNLYGVISRTDFVEIFNDQNDEQTTADEVYTLLLPKVVKTDEPWYAFYKDYIVHYWFLDYFDRADALIEEQADKPRYVPNKDELIKCENQYYVENNEHWGKFEKIMLTEFGNSGQTSAAFEEIKDYVIYDVGISRIGPILEKHECIFSSDKQAHKFFGLLMDAKNNTRLWDNKGYTPNEMADILRPKGPTLVRRPDEFEVYEPKKVGRNDPCPCGSGKKYKKCCALTAESGSAQLSFDERKLFYETWYKLLAFVNEKLKVVNYKFSLKYPDTHDETLLYRIREKLWAQPKLITDFIAAAEDLTAEEIDVLKGWRDKHAKGMFMLVKYAPTYAVFMGAGKDGKARLYAVKGMTTSVAESMSRQLPAAVETVLVPMNGKITYDSFIITKDVNFGEGVRARLAVEYESAFREFGLSESL